MNDSICSTLSRIHIHKEQAPEQAPMDVPQPMPQPQYQTNKPELNGDGTPVQQGQPRRMVQRPGMPPMPDGMDRPGYIDPSMPHGPRIPVVGTKTPRLKNPPI